MVGFGTRHAHVADADTSTFTLSAISGPLDFGLVYLPEILHPFGGIDKVERPDFPRCAGSKRAARLDVSNRRHVSFLSRIVEPYPLNRVAHCVVGRRSTTREEDEMSKAKRVRVSRRGFMKVAAAGGICVATMGGAGMLAAVNNEAKARRRENG